jgi:hypothetical protein
MRRRRYSASGPTLGSNFRPICLFYGEMNSYKIIYSGIQVVD